MNHWRDLCDAASPLGFTLAHSLWQTGLLALGYAALRAQARRAGVPFRYRAALLALALGLLAAGATFWTLQPARESDIARDAPGGTQPSGDIPGALTTRLATLVPVARPGSFDLARVLGGVAVLWAGGVLVLASRLLGGVLLAGQIRGRAAPVRRDDLVLAQRRLANRLGLARPVALLLSDEVETPVALGWRRPAVLLPSALLPAELAVLEPLLAHELAHVRGQDYATNLAQSGLDVLLFFCPGARWLSAEVRRLREYRCDDLAAALSDSPARYLRALARLAEANAPRFPAPAATGPRLVDRIRRLSEGELMSRPRAIHTLTLFAAAITLALLGSSLLDASRLYAARKAGPAVALGQPSTAMPALRLTSIDFSGRDEFPLFLDGLPVDRPSLPLETRGTLTLVHRELVATAPTPIAFSLSLRRAGGIVEAPLQGRTVFEVDLGEVLAGAQAGDQLIIDAADPRERRARRIIGLGDGC